MSLPLGEISTISPGIISRKNSAPIEVKAQDSDETTQPSTPSAATARDGDPFEEEEEEESMMSSLEEIEDLLDDSPLEATESHSPTPLLVSLGRGR